MKNINQFDYPSKQTLSYKANSQISDSQQAKDQVKARYKQNLQYHMQLQRNNVKKTQKMKKQHESKRKKEHLETQLDRKRKELENLESLKKQAEQNQKKSYELALIKQEQDRIRKQEQERKKLQFEQNAAVRFSEAMKKLSEEKQELAFKERLAQQRRTTTRQFQKMERVKAEKYRSFVAEKQKCVQKQNCFEADQYRKTIKQFVSNPHPDYNRTCVHNLKVVSEIKKQQENAIERAKNQDNQMKEKSEEKKRKQENDDRKSKQRGNEAWIKIQREKQYEDFEKMTTQHQKKYNLARIQAGKKNQSIGVKPTTLSQMQNNKKKRSEQEFDNMFYSKSALSTGNLNVPATKYQMVEHRVSQRHSSSAFNRPSEIKQREGESQLKNQEESRYQNVSKGMYSFEEQCYSEFKNQSRSQNNIEQDTQQNEQEEQQPHHFEGTMKNSLKQTRIPEEKLDNSSKKLNLQSYQHGQRQVNQGFRQKEKPIKKEKYQQDAFDTNEMLRKYGLVKGSAVQTQPIDRDGRKADSKRKVVELASICQKKQPEKQELNYSSESEQDSLT